MARCMPGLAARPFAIMATTGITRMGALRMVTMGRSILWAACLSERDRGITAGTGEAILAGPGTATVVVDMATVVGDTAIGRDTPMVVRDPEIAQATPIGAVRVAAMPEAGTAATVVAGITVAETSAVEVDSVVAAGAASMEVAAATVAAALMVEVADTEADTAKS